VWVTARDERVCEWLRIVRVTDVQALRWLLGVLNETDEPVSTRRAQAWVARMELVGLVERTNLGGPGGSIVWGTYEATGQARPNVYRQTTRHEIAVSAISARYLAAGFSWGRDDRPKYVGGHQADGVAVGVRSTELIEVELTAKRAPRYASIFSAYRRRLEYGEADRVAYLCTDNAAKAVRAGLEASPAGRAVAARIAVRAVFDERGTLRVSGTRSLMSDDGAMLRRDEG
jgi:hypothetical protein